LFEFLRNDKLNARNFFSTTVPEFRRNQFGGTVGGPVLIPKLYSGRDRTFFFFSWESYVQRQGSTGLDVVPSTAMRQGDFSAFAPIKDPLATGTFFPGNQIPLSRQSPAALKAQAFYPLPNRPGPNNYFVNTASASDTQTPTVKIDQRFGSRDSLSFKYLESFDWSLTPQNIDLSFGGNARDHRWTTGLSYTHMFSPTVINEARFSLTRGPTDTVGLHQGVNYNAQFGIPAGPTDPKLIGFPEIEISGDATLGEPFQWPVFQTTNTYQTADTVTWVRGPH